MSLGYYALSAPYISSGMLPFREELEAQFLYLDYAESLYSNYLKKMSTAPEGSESLASFMHSFITEAERKADPYGERWLLAHISDKKISSDYLLSSIAPRMRERGGLYAENFNNLQNISCFFGRSVVSPDHAYIGFYLPEIKHVSSRTYTSILASMRHRRYFAVDAPGAYYKNGDRIMVYIKIPSSNTKDQGEKHEGE